MNNQNPINGNFKKLNPLGQFCINLGMIPTSYTEAMTYEEQILWLCNFYNTQILPVVNNNSNLTEEAITKFNELYNYVTNYFNNLDVQDEINKKLDEMVEDGTLEKIINEQIFNNKMDKTKLDFYGINIKGTSNSNCFIVKFNNGKTMFIDTGGDYEWAFIKNAITNLGITKFDYGIITHFHGDHVGNMLNFINNFDLSTCTIYTYIPSIDLTTSLPDYQTLINNFKTLCDNANITYTSPLHNTTLEIDEYTSIRWLNNNSEWYNDYINTISEYRTDENTGNDFSLVAEITHNNIKILSTGDIEQAAETNLKDYVTKCNLITGCHHLSNRAINIEFFENCNPDICVTGTSQANMNNTKCEMKEYNFYLANGRPIYPLGYGLGDVTHFYSNGSSLQLLTPGYSNGYHKTSLYGSVYEIINTIPIDVANIHLSEILDNMQDGEILNGVLWQTYLPLYQDLQAIFPFLQNGMLLTIKNTNSKRHHYITIESLPDQGQNYKFTACKKDDIGTHIWSVLGYGTIPRQENYNDLTTILPQLPQGKYTLQYTPTNDPELIADGDTYVLDINIFNKGSGNIIATPRGNNSKTSYLGYLINNSLYWKPLNNLTTTYLATKTDLTNFIANNKGTFSILYTPDSSDSTWLDTSNSDNYILTLSLVNKNNGSIIAIPRGDYTKTVKFASINNGIIHSININ